MKRITTILFLLSVCLTACGESINFEEATGMSDIITAEVVENDQDNKAMVMLTLDPDYIAEVSELVGDDYTAEIVIDDYTLPMQDGSTSYWPETYGSKNYEVTVYDGKGDSAVTTTGKVEIHLSTWFTELYTQEGGDIFHFSDGECLTIFTQPRARGNDDICWMYRLRIPEGKSLTFSTQIELIGSVNPVFTDVLQVHANMNTAYSERKDWYDGKEYKVIDTDPAYSVDFPLTLEEGIYTVYVCPSVRHDLSLLTVLYTGDKSGGHMGYFKSIDYEALGL